MKRHADCDDRTGYVGLVFRRCFSDFGTTSSASTRTRARFRRLSRDHADLRARPRRAGGEQRACRAAYLTTALAAAVAEADAVFIAVGTPSGRWRRTCRSLLRLRRDSRNRRRDRRAVVIVTKSTVPVHPLILHF